MTIPVTFHFLFQRLGPQLVLGEPLFFPDQESFGNQRKSVAEGLGLMAVRTFEQIDAIHRGSRHLAGPPSVEQVSFTLEPPRKQRAMLEPVTVSFHYASWTQGEGAHLAYLPALQIEVLATTAARLRTLVESEARFALMRQKAAQGSLALALRQRTRFLQLQTIVSSISLTPPKDAAREAQHSKAKEKSMASQLTTLLRPSVRKRVYEMDAVISRIAQALAGPPPQSVLLVGPSGVGKTAAAGELARHRAAHGMGHFDFRATSGARLVAGATGFGMWQERCLNLCKELARRPVVLMLGSLFELMQVGRSEHQSQGIAGFLRPILQRGDLQAIAECTIEELAVIEREDARLLETFTRIDVAEPDAATFGRIMRAAADELGVKRRTTLTEPALTRLDQLHRRYATYSAFPGRPIRFLRHLLSEPAESSPQSSDPPAVASALVQQDSPVQAKVTESQVVAAFSRETGLPLFMIDDDVPLSLGEISAWFDARIIGQAQAVQAVVETMARVKARLTRPGKPIASFLFIGPTGVGKTELAKSLATYLFGDVSRLVRVDMSEYSHEGAATRLIGGTLSSEGYLTAKVREQPFCVVLLDEFEKADGSVLDLLLQVLGEGRLTDAAGRVADFSNCVIVMTSNLGAQSYQSGPFGFAASADQRQSAISHFTEEVRAHLRPELFNRIDRIVPFAPLDEAAALAIARREIDLIRRRDGVLMRRLRLELSDEVVTHLARTGFDARYGARPLKRAIEQQLLAPMADGLNGYSHELPLVARGAMAAGDVVVKVGGDSGADQKGAADASIGMLDRCQRLRRALGQVRRHQVVVETINELFTAQREAGRLTKMLSSTQAGTAAVRRRRPALEKQLGKWQTVIDRLGGPMARLTALEEAMERVEDEAMLALCERRLDVLPVVLASVVSLATQMHEWVLAFYLARTEPPKRLTLALFSDEPEMLLSMIRGFMPLMAPDCIAGAARFFRFKSSTDKPRKKDAGPIRMSPLTADKAADELAHLVDGQIGAAWEVTDARLIALVRGEGGRHVHVDAQRKQQVCLADAYEDGLASYVAPQGIERRCDLDTVPVRRTYNARTHTIIDPRLSRQTQWSGRDLETILPDIVRDNLLIEAYAFVQLEPPV